MSTASETWNITCVVNEDDSDPFHISCRRDLTIDQLKEVIHQECHTQVSHLTPHQLKLYLVECASDDYDIAGKVNIFLPPPQPGAQIASEGPISHI